jgi:hypothetical protein
MADPGKTGVPPDSKKAPDQELEERWKEAVDALTESPRDVELVIKAGQISEQLRRGPEAYNYYRKALVLDPSKSFLLSKLRALAVTSEQKEEVAKFAKRPASFAASLGDIPLYPVRGKGLPLLLMGAIFLWGSRLLIRGGGGITGLSIAGASSAYMAMFYIDVCHSTINGDDQLPDWPDPLRLSEVFSHVAKFFMAKVVAFLPVIVILLGFGLEGFRKPERADIPDFQMQSGRRTPPAPPVLDGTAQPLPENSAPPISPTPAPPPAPPRISWGVLAPMIAIMAWIPIGLVYLPMATLSNVVMGSPWTCFHVPFIVRSIVATPKNYGICLGAYLGTFVMFAGAEFVGALIGILPTGLAVAFFELYGMTVLMRLMGLFYLMNQAKLNWMAD